MVSPDQDRILYVDQEDEPTLLRSASVAMKLAVLAVMVGMLYLAFGQLALRPDEVTAVLNAIEKIPSPVIGFDASSGDFTVCDTTLHTLPDFSIVVAGSGSGEGQPPVSRLMQFVVVDTFNDFRYGRDFRMQTLCTLP